jgi:hypothetical protein
MEGETVMERTSPARVYAVAFGAVLVLAGLVGFLYNGSFTVGEDVPSDAVLGILDVNAWHNLVHIATGALGLAAASSLVASRAYAFGLGGVYILVALWGFILGDGGVILGLVPVNTEDNVLHLLIGVLGIAVGVVSGVSPRAAAGRA